MFKDSLQFFSEFIFCEFITSLYFKNLQSHFFMRRGSSRERIQHVGAEGNLLFLLKHKSELQFNDGTPTYVSSIGSLKSIAHSINRIRQPEEHIGSRPDAYIYVTCRLIYRKHQKILLLLLMMVLRRLMSCQSSHNNINILLSA